MSRIIAIASLLAFSVAEPCTEVQQGIKFVREGECLQSVTCANGAVPVFSEILQCYVATKDLCAHELFTSFERVAQDDNVLCITYLSCAANEVQVKPSVQEDEACERVPEVGPESLDASIRFTVQHTIELQKLRKFHLFAAHIDNVIRSVAAEALDVEVTKIAATTALQTETFHVDIQLPANLVANANSRSDFGIAFERVLSKYQPFSGDLDVYRILPGDMTSINFWDAQADPNDDAGQSSGIADPDYNPTQQDDDTAIIIVIVVASIVFVCGAGVVIHHFRKKHKVVYAETSMDDAIAVPVSEGAGPVEEVGGGGLRVFKAKQHWSGDDSDPKLSSPLKLQKGDIIAAFEMDGIMYGYLRGTQPVDGSVEQVIRDGQFPKDAVEEVADVQNYNNEFLWWAETSDDGKQYLHWVYIKGISMERSRGIPDCDCTASTTTPRSDVFSTVELTCSPEEILASTLTSKLEALKQERSG